METITYFFDLVFHLDRHLEELKFINSTWLYVLFFMVIFVETGVVVMPFLPGDSFLFVIGSFAALTHNQVIDVVTVSVLLCIAAILGDTINYSIGKAIGPRAFNFPQSRFFNRKALIATHNFYEKYGGITIILARFMPFARTFAPFVAGIGAMRYRTFLFYNIIGGVAWVVIFISAGYWFGNIPVVRQNFSLVALGIVFVSVLPMVIMAFNKWLAHRREQKHRS